MRATLQIDDELLEEAARLTHITDTAALVHAGLEALIARESAQRIASLASALAPARVPAVRSSRARSSSDPD